MWTTAKIRRHIQALEPGEKFATRDCLNYGTRTAVDRALSRMVNCGYIERLAWGVFRKADRSNPPVTPYEIARFKALVFGRRLASDMAHAARRLGLKPPAQCEGTFVTDGRSTSFRFAGGVIYIKGSSPKKLALADCKAGHVIQALWHLGERSLDGHLVARATRDLGRSDRYQLRHWSAFMPAWLSDYLNHQSGSQNGSRARC